MRREHAQWPFPGDHAHQTSVLRDRIPEPEALNFHDDAEHPDRDEDRTDDRMRQDSNQGLSPCPLGPADFGLGEIQRLQYDLQRVGAQVHKLLLQRFLTCERTVACLSNKDWSVVNISRLSPGAIQSVAQCRCGGAASFTLTHSPQVGSGSVSRLIGSPRPVSCRCA